MSHVIVSHGSPVVSGRRPAVCCRKADSISTPLAVDAQTQPTRAKPKTDPGCLVAALPRVKYHPPAKLECGVESITYAD